MSEFGMEHGSESPQDFKMERGEQAERPSSEEVMATMESLVGGDYTEKERDADEDGLRRLVLEADGNVEGDTTEYIYDRAKGTVEKISYEDGEDKDHEVLGRFEGTEWHSAN